MRRTSLVLAALFLVALVATPALAGPDRDGKRRPPATKDLQKQIQKLTKELKVLEKRLEKAQAARPEAEKAERAAAAGRRELGEQQRRMAEARRRLAGLLAERGRADAPGPHAPGAGRRPDEHGGPMRGGPDARGGGGDWMGALRRLHEENRRLAARVETLEGQIQRLGRAIRGLVARGGGHRGHGRMDASRGRRGRGGARRMAWGRMDRRPEGRQAGRAHGKGPRWSRMPDSDRRHRAPRGRGGPAWGHRAFGRQGGAPRGQGAGMQERGRRHGACPHCDR